MRDLQMLKKLKLEEISLRGNSMLKNFRDGQAYIRFDFKKGWDLQFLRTRRFNSRPNSLKSLQIHEATVSHAVEIGEFQLVETGVVVGYVA